jgi:outer membrane protein
MNTRVLNRYFNNLCGCGLRPDGSSLGLLLGFILMLGPTAHAQEQWSLPRCLDYYQQHSTRVLQQNFARDQARLQVQASKRGFLPVVEARWRSANNWGFLIDPSTNILDRRYNLGNQAVVDASWDLFNGPAANPVVKLRTQELAVANYAYQATTEAVALDITYLYLQALLGREQVGNARQQMSHLQTKQKQISRQVAEGLLSRRDLLNMQFQVASEALRVVEAETGLEKAKLNLMQAMGLRQDSLIDVEAVAVPDSVLVAGLGATWQLPSGEGAADVQVARARVGVAAARILATRYDKLPTLSVGAQLATRTSNSQKSEFGTQLTNNFNQQAVVSLVVPVLNNRVYRSNIAIARSEMAAAEVVYRQSVEDFRQRALVAALDYKAAHRKLGASQRGYDAALEENRFAEKQLQLGIINSVDYGEVQARLSAARSELLQTKYDCLFKLKCLEYYSKHP